MKSSCNKWFTGLLNRTFIPLKVLSLAKISLAYHHTTPVTTNSAVTDNLLCHHLSPVITNLFYKPHYRMWLLPRIIYLWRSHQQNLKYNRAPIVNAFHHRHAHLTSKSIKYNFFEWTYDMLPFYILKLFSWAMETEIQHSYWKSAFLPLLSLIGWQVHNCNHPRDILAI